MHARWVLCIYDGASGRICTQPTIWGRMRGSSERGNASSSLLKREERERETSVKRPGVFLRQSCRHSALLLVIFNVHVAFHPPRLSRAMHPFARASHGQLNDVRSGGSRAGQRARHHFRSSDGDACFAFGRRERRRGDGGTGGGGRGCAERTRRSSGILASPVSEN